MAGVTTEEQQKPLAEQLDELGAQLDWVREYL
jgi:valyl-tRNA synthetase